MQNTESLIVSATESVKEYSRMLTAATEFLRAVDVNRLADPELDALQTFCLALKNIKETPNGN